MRALLEDLKSGEVSTHDVPAPEIQAGGILVRTAFSAISAGTTLRARWSAVTSACWIVTGS